MSTGSVEALDPRAPAGGGADVPIAARSPGELFRRRFREDRLATAALLFLLFLVLVAVLAPLIVKLFGAPDPNFQDRGALDAFGTPTGPSSSHLFGVDELGRDVFSRTLYGAQVSLIVAFAATALAVLAGIAAGLIAGYFRGWIDTGISRKMILEFDAPSDREASTNSFSRSDRVWPRTIRAMKVQLVKAITKITTAIPGFSSPPKQPSPNEQAAAIPVASSR